MCYCSTIYTVKEVKYYYIYFIIYFSCVVQYQLQARDSYMRGNATEGNFAYAKAQRYIKMSVIFGIISICLVIALIVLRVVLTTALYD